MQTILLAGGLGTRLAEDTRLSAVYTIVRPMIGADWPASLTALAVLVLVSTRLNVLPLDIQGESIGRMFPRVQRRPLTAIEQEPSDRRIKDQRRAKAPPLGRRSTHHAAA